MVCAAQVFVQLGAGYWPVLLPEMMTRWSLSNSAAGWIPSAFYATYMVSVPVLVTLTDRVDAKRVYLLGVGCTLLAHLAFGLLADGFWSALALRGLAGIGWAGTYMTGLKLVSDQVDAKMMSRAAAGHAARISISGALSYGLGDLLAQELGWRLAFASAGLTATIAWLTVALAVPGRAAAPKSAARNALFDFRPVLRNRSAFAYSLAYCAHTLEMNALRGWARGFAGAQGYWIAVGLILVYGMIIWLDSSSLTAGAAGAADPARRGATLAVPSMLGYAGGFVGPLAIGWTLDFSGGMSAVGWGLAFAIVAAIMGWRCSCIRRFEGPNSESASEWLPVLDRARRPLSL
jgi:MFS family permease